MDQIDGTIFVDILNSEGTVVDSTNARLLGDLNGQSSAAVYEYSIWANPGEKLTFVPWDSRYMYHNYFPL